MLTNSPNHRRCQLPTGTGSNRPPPRSAHANIPSGSGPRLISWVVTWFSRWAVPDNSASSSLRNALVFEKGHFDGGTKGGSRGLLLLHTAQARERKIPCDPCAACIEKAFLAGYKVSTEDLRTRTCSSFMGSKVTAQSKTG